MKKLFLILLSGLFCLNAFSNPKITFKQESRSPQLIQQQILLEPNRMSTWIQNTGTFNQDIRTSNTPGCMWPAGSNRFIGFSAGLTIGAKVLNAIRLVSCSYKGEYSPGFINNGVPDSNTNFKLYKVSRGDGPSNPDWANWYRMVPYGAPYYDVNNNGIYDQGIDTPGVHNARQTVFICMTDGFQFSHNQSEGFSGGTLPLFTETHFTAWGYSKEEYADMQFMKYEIINKGSNVWDSTFMSFICDEDLGNANDDYIGCDTVLQLGYMYNADNMDGDGNPPSYGANPPAAGKIILKGAKIKGSVPVNLNMTSFVYFTNDQSLTCLLDPSLPIEAYNYLRGYKKDGAYWHHPFTKQRSIKVYTGEPETNTGWTEFGYNGNTNMAQIKNCIGGDTITTFSNPPGDRRYIMGTGASNLVVSPGDTQTVIICQLVARGTNNLNSVTKLKQLAAVAWQFYNNNFVIGVQNISTEVPTSFSLSQNFPNPFNPSTKIRFSIPENGKLKSENGIITLKVYDILGKEVAALVNERMQPGTYEVNFNADGLSSGVYFYKLSAGNFLETKRMLLLK
ncbi:MAG: T9SS type A sorting domain-containing protein [Ignavibacteria bacterium]|nr:T9SS type A sorting domain-containing protein [Ignavibacteria bacterium]